MLVSKIFFFFFQYHEDADGQLFTPLLVASKNGHDKIVSHLISKYNIDLEMEGITKADGYLVKRACAMWCAASKRSSLTENY